MYWKVTTKTKSAATRKTTAMNKIILVLFFMVAIATVANGEGLISKICIDIKDHPTAAANDLENALAQANAVKTYPLSIQYVKDHSSELLAGGDLCKEFFTGLITQFKADLQNNGQSTVTDAEATKELLEIIKKKFGV